MYFPKDKSIIQYAIDKAKTGSIIKIPAGTYTISKYNQKEYSTSTLISYR